MLDPVEHKPLQPDWKPGKPKRPGVFQVLLERALFGSRVHSAQQKGWQKNGRDVLIVSGALADNVPRVVAHREPPSVWDDLEDSK